MFGRRSLRGRGFEVVEDAAGIQLSVTGAWSAKAAATVRSGQIDSVVLNYARGFREPNLEFLRGLPIRGLSIMSYTLTDLAPIYSLSATLTHLSFGRLRGPIDLARLPQLRTLSTDWSSIESTIQSAPALQELELEGYRPHDLLTLSHLPYLQRLQMWHYPNLRTLDGLQAFPLLEDLRVVIARQLIDITAVVDPSLSRLTRLNLSTCRKIADLAPIAGRTALTYLNVSNCGDLPSAEPLADLIRLEALHLYDSTNILDGDLNPIAQLPHLRDFRMMNRRHYRPAVQAIQESIADR